MTKDEALKLALEALEQLDGIDTETECVTIDVGDVITAIKEALAPTSTQCEVQPEQKPWMYRIWNDKDAQWRLTDDCSWPAEPVYTTPPQRPWVRLTFAEICEAEVVATEGFNNFSELKFARAIDAKLKELNT